jgi:hypothetical protein
VKKWWLSIALVPLCVSQVEAKDLNDPYGTDWVELALGCTGETCVIQMNRGGFIRDFHWAARQVLLRNIKVSIDGPCQSSCTIFASLARKNVCLTQNAEMGIHMGYINFVFDPDGKAVDLAGSHEGRLIFGNLPKGYRLERLPVHLDYGKDINAWAEAHGKMASHTSMYTLTHEEALMFWVPCP